MSVIQLLSNEIAIGHCVIVNDADRPAPHLAAVIKDIADGFGFVRYLCANTLTDDYAGPLDRMTPLASFVNLSQGTPRSPRLFSTAADEYISLLEVIGAPPAHIAKYENGEPRPWQGGEDYAPQELPARPDVLAFAIEQAQRVAGDNLVTQKAQGFNNAS